MFSHKIGDLVHYCKCKSAIGVVVGINEGINNSGYRVRYLSGDYFIHIRTILWYNEEINKKVFFRERKKK